nr:hypothetical protein P5660_06600 [Bacillus velezensis]
MKKISILLSVVVLSLGLLSIPVGKAQAATGRGLKLERKAVRSEFGLTLIHILKKHLQLIGMEKLTVNAEH